MGFGRAPSIMGFQVLLQLLYSIRRAYVLSMAEHPCIHHKPEGPQKELARQMVVGEPQLGRLWLSSQDHFHRPDASTLGVSEIVVQALRTITFNREDWEDYMLAAIRMSVAWRARRRMPHFFVEKDDECASPPPTLYYFLCESWWREGFANPYICDLFFVECRDRTIPFDMVLWGRFQGNLQHKEVTMVETLPPPVGVDRAMALASHGGAMT